MAASYRSLSTNMRYLKGVAFDSGDSVLVAQDRTEAEEQAAVEIETALGKTFAAAPLAPPIIALLGVLIGSAVIYENLALSKNFGGEEAEGARKPSYLRKKAQQILDDLRAHKIGVMNLDGSWDALYPQPSILPTIGLGGAKNIAIDAGLQWGQMAQGAITDDEKRALDETRSRRAYDIEAAYAGAYGL